MVVGFTTTCAISAYHFKHFVSFLDFTKKSWMGTLMYGLLLSRNSVIIQLVFPYNCFVHSLLTLSINANKGATKLGIPSGHIYIETFSIPKMGLVYVIGIWILRIFSPDFMIGFWKCSGRVTLAFHFPWNHCVIFFLYFI
jgi:hypothetical protein